MKGIWQEENKYISISQELVMQLKGPLHKEPGDQWQVADSDEVRPLLF